MRVWDVAALKRLDRVSGRIFGEDVNSVAFSPDGKRLATGSNDEAVRIWDFDSGHANSRLCLTTRETITGRRIFASPTARCSASVNENGTIKIWNPNRKPEKLIRTIRGESDQLRRLAFTPDGQSVAAAGQGKVVRIWDVLS